MGLLFQVYLGLKNLSEEEKKVFFCAQEQF